MVWNIWNLIILKRQDIIQWRKLTQTGMASRRKSRRATDFSAERAWCRTQLRCQQSGHICSFFFFRNRISAHGNNSSESNVLNATSLLFGIEHKTLVAIGEDNQGVSSFAKNSSRTRGANLSWQNATSTWKRQNKGQFLCFTTNW